MRSIPLRVGTAILVAVSFSWVLGNAFQAAFVVRVAEPLSPFHVPEWLEPFAYTAQLVTNLLPGLLLGVLARWRPATLGAAVGFLSIAALAVVPDSREAILSIFGLELALRESIYWAAGAIVGMHVATRGMPNKSLERTREG